MNLPQVRLMEEETESFKEAGRVYKKIVLLLSAIFCMALVFSMSACGKQDNTQYENGLSDSQTHTMEELENPVADKTENKTNDTASERIYDNRLITDAVSIEDGFQDEYGVEYTVSIHIPKLQSDAPEAQALNREIMDTWEGLVAKTQEEYEDNFCRGISLTWESHWNGSLLSLVMVEDRPDASLLYSVFHYDFDTEERVSSSQILDRMNIKEEELRTAFCRAAAQDFDHIFAGGMAGPPEEMALLRAKTVAEAAGAVHDPNIYPNEDGSITAFLDFFVPAGAGYAQWEEKVTLNWKAEPLSFAANGIVASVNSDGTVEIYFEEGSTQEEYQELYGFECGRTYPVSGCFSNYEQLFVCTMGPDYNPYLFLRTDQNTVEVVRIFGGTYFGKLVNSGPLYGLSASGDMADDWPEFVDFGPAPDANGSATVFAIAKDGRRYDLAAFIDTAENSFPYALGGSWGTSITRPGGEVIDYTIAVLNDNPIRELIFVESGEDYYVEYNGILGYMGMDETGMIYGYTLTGPDGNELVGALSFLPLGESLQMRVVGGEDLLDGTDDLELQKNMETEETTVAKKETTEYMVAPILTAGEPPFTNMRYIYSVNNPDGGYYYEDITEDGYTTVINHAHVSWLDDYGEDMEYYMSYGAWVGISDDPGSIRDLYMEKNEVYSERLGCPVYVLSFKTGLKENTSCWTVFAAEAYGYTYLYAFDVWEGASEGMDEIIADYFNRLALVDVSAPSVGNTQ